jgi:hypothetical protein
MNIGPDEVYSIRKQDVHPIFRYASGGKPDSQGVAFG